MVEPPYEHASHGSQSGYRFGVGKRIAVFFLGGTISMAPAADGQGVVSTLGADELLRSVPGLDALNLTVEPHDAGRIPSASLRFPHILGVLRAAADSGADGVVLVQGTDTIEETAFLADLLWSSPAPFVVTGAMRNPTVAGPDGPANLLAAITVAASDSARDLGALVVMNDDVHAARFVAKRDTSSTAAFVSPGHGPLGHTVEGRLVLGMRVARRATYPIPDVIDASVPVLPFVLGDDGALLRAADDGSGLVIAGVGGGHVPDHLVERIGHLAKSMPIILTSRTGGGPTLTNTYGASGAEIDLIARGVIASGSLDAFKARLLLLVLLADGQEGDDGPALRAAFAQY